MVAARVETRGSSVACLGSPSNMRVGSLFIIASCMSTKLRLVAFGDLGASQAT